MINQGINVPDNTICIFADYDYDEFSKNRIENILTPLPKKRDWFTSHFYRCLPLVIGNQYGFVIKSEFDFAFIWDGGDTPDAVKFWFNEEQNIVDKKLPRIESHFGSGIITINPPFTLRTPPGVNLMTINPPNYIVPNITVMTGVVEADNIRRNFTFNLKVQTPNVETVIRAGTPLAAFIPLPRYYVDGFKLEYAENIFDKELINEELKAVIDAKVFRDTVEPTLPNGVGRQYFNGEDIYGNKFPDHQK